MMQNILQILQKVDIFHKIFSTYNKTQERFDWILQFTITKHS